ncbi:MAG: c-type cytochrome [Candidatus Lambdaproteobacteria bacterium]|nr:c-type cytochrome [Candidatus Lambdaproteobacteria bacterium]
MSVARSMGSRCHGRPGLPALAALLVVIGTAKLAWSQAPRPPQSEQTLAEGRRIYSERCVYCHGEKGDGNGPVADYLDPRPRDFTVGMFKLRTTHSGELPTDEDLFRVVSRGIPGTAMPRWELTLSEEQRWKVVDFIKAFSPEFADRAFDPASKVVQASAPIPPSPESIAKGRAVFERAKCFECHGRDGRGDGQKSDTLEDGWGFKLRVRNLTRGWNLKGGAEPQDIYYRFTTGLNGTPMPSFRTTLSEEERWHLANYIASLARTRESEQVVVKAKRVSGDLPQTPEHPDWKLAEALQVPLTGQVLARPRWQNISVELVEARALYNDRELALLLVWDDPFADTEHHADREVSRFEATYVRPFADIPRKPGVFRDAIAVQFPVRLREGARKPHFFRGDASDPVNLWLWKADRQRQGLNPVEEYNARGFRTPLVLQPEGDQHVHGGGSWQAGQWRVVVRRALRTEDRQDIQFEEGRLIPIAFNSWDGSNGEHGLIMSLSAWSFLALEAPVPASLYLYALLALLAVGLGEWWFVRYSRRRSLELAWQDDPERVAPTGWRGPVV